MQQLPEIEKVDSSNEISCLKWTLYIGRRKVCIGFESDMNKLNNCSLPLPKQYIRQRHRNGAQIV